MSFGYAFITSARSFQLRGHGGLLTSRLKGYHALSGVRENDRKQDESTAEFGEMSNDWYSRPVLFVVEFEGFCRNPRKLREVSIMAPLHTVMVRTGVMTSRDKTVRQSVTLPLKVILKFRSEAGSKISDRSSCAEKSPIRKLSYYLDSPLPERNYRWFVSLLLYPRTASNAAMNLIASS